MEFREQITIGVIFLVFAYFASLGFWQLVATWQRLKALLWLPRDVKARWGYSLGSSLVALASLWFFGTRSEEIFSPGPASSEFLFFWSAGLALALVTTVVISLFLDRLRASLQGLTERQRSHSELIALKWLRGTLYLPSSGDAPWPVVCMAPEPGAGIESLEGVAVGLTESGFAAFSLDMSSEDSWRYPDALVEFPQAIAYLDGRDEINASRVGAVGVGLGADLAIRAAAEDKQIKAVVALAPVMLAAHVRSGLDLLREMSYPEAIRWSRVHQRGELVTRLGASEHVSDLDSQPLLIIYGEEDRLVPSAELDAFQRTMKVKLIPGQGRRGLERDTQVVSLITGWSHEHI
ncbi:MAG: hypothetical protein CEE40_02890 [Chloroflexi bacterium B3_Chlor]|nr:MAG: hypothetical protein CEE40_02890 [Chloroflexi bacterium B3_Chlor]